MLVQVTSCFFREKKQMRSLLFSCGDEDAAKR